MLAGGLVQVQVTPVDDPPSVGDSDRHLEQHRALDRSVTYTPAVDFVGSDAFTFSVPGGAVTTAAATV